MPNIYYDKFAGSKVEWMILAMSKSTKEILFANHYVSSDSFYKYIQDTNFNCFS